MQALSVSSHLQNEVTLEPVKLASDPNVESIDPILRGCLFHHEQPENYTIKAHQMYTQVRGTTAFVWPEI